MIENFKCHDGCCDIKIKPYVDTDEEYDTRISFRKAGVCIYDPKRNKVLLIQSKGNLWGFPKGSLEYAESDRICAIREVLEETGLVISCKEFIKSTCIRNDAIYYYMEKDMCEVFVQDHIPNNDATGIGWIKLDCLVKLVDNGNITPNSHCRTVLSRFMNIILPYTNFILVTKNNKKSLKL